MVFNPNQAAREEARLVQFFPGLYASIVLYWAEHELCDWIKTKKQREEKSN